MPSTALPLVWAPALLLLMFVVTGLVVIGVLLLEDMVEGVVVEVWMVVLRDDDVAD